MFPCLSDNYGFLLHCPDTGSTASIDTPEADKIIQACEDIGWTLTHILNTHHHPDHVGGNLELAEMFELEIFGPERDQHRTPGMTRGVGHNERFRFGLHDIQVFETPGHTTGHIIYYVPSASAAFVGDTLFVMGCGRLFEGTPEQMHKSLSLIAALPDDTALYCAHEYTLSNGRFALTVEPDNQELITYMDRARDLRDQGLPTVPTTVAREKKINPFVRAKTAQDLGRIRQAKDRF